MRVNRMSRVYPYVVVPLVVFAILSRMGVVAHAEDSERRIGTDVYRERVASKRRDYRSIVAVVHRFEADGQWIANVANRQYEHPFRFALVRQKQPNAFAVPGGNVYISDSLMRFVRYREALAGVLCHETAHTIVFPRRGAYRRSQRRRHVRGSKFKSVGSRQTQLRPSAKAMPVESSRCSRIIHATTTASPTSKRIFALIPSVSRASSATRHGERHSISFVDSYRAWVRPKPGPSDATANAIAATAANPAPVANVTVGP